MDLSGIEVLDLTRLLPGPAATQYLADLGADVLKIEAPGVGDYARDLPPFTESGVGAIYDAVNRGKRSVGIDLKREDGRALFYRLAADADVLVEGFRPGVTDRLGVDYETIAEHNPDSIYCSLSGFGQTGPLADAVGHDLTYEGYAGLLDLTRESEDASPQIPGFPMADMAGGTFAAFSIVSALLSRELGGGGEYLDVSLTEVLTAFGQPLVYDAVQGDPPRPGTTPYSGGLPWYDVYETADGGYVTLAALEPRFWQSFCEAVDREELASVHGTDDTAERDALRAELKSLFQERTREEWLEALEGTEATVGPVLTFAEALEHRHLAERGLLREAASGAPRLDHPAVVNGERPAASGDSPKLGADTRDVLTAAGIHESRIDALVADGVLATPEA